MIQGHIRLTVWGEIHAGLKFRTLQVCFNQLSSSVKTKAASKAYAIKLNKMPGARECRKEHCSFLELYEWEPCHGLCFLYLKEFWDVSNELNVCSLFPFMLNIMEILDDSDGSYFRVPIPFYIHFLGIVTNS